MQFALLVSVIVALLLGAFILLTHTQSVFKIKSDELITAYEELNTALLQLPEKITINDTIREESPNSVTKLHLSYYGLWLKAHAQVTKHGRSVAKTALIGSASIPQSPNLYLCNTNAPLVVVGSTRLEGNVYLPEQGIKAGNIAGNYYQGTRLYYGTAYQSSTTLPELDPQWIAYLNGLIDPPQQSRDTFTTLTNEVKNSFQHPVRYVFNPDPVFIGNQKLYGNIIIQSLSSVTISAASDLQDVIIVAPRIKIENGVTGRMQLFATQKLEIGSNCQLNYPSSALLYDTQVNKPTNNTAIDRAPDFRIQPNTEIQGTVLYLKKSKERTSNVKTNLKIDPEVMITGEVYCQGNLDMLGTVQGALYTQQFTANQSGSIYLNHLYNTKVLINPVEDYAGLPLGNQTQRLAKWLY
ncbi:hypothetical protein [Aquimarina brevivitae]|uniref:Cytoskeletal protein CcmA (Bactofilin family) n=1 Tax=Aquimarina brevivitae TaxID=323412 RepID=A0A4Q7PG22_9FLAO|nr:hypothetical protein [Aquimarina brevivitae]RZS98808.1 hypothetical protein EV197_0008 [Aquimarina brevivitae]